LTTILCKTTFKGKHTTDNRDVFYTLFAFHRLLIKNNNSFLIKRSGVQFSSEAGNLLNKNSFKFSGLANNKVYRRAYGTEGTTGEYMHWSCGFGGYL